MTKRRITVCLLLIVIGLGLYYRRISASRRAALMELSTGLGAVPSATYGTAEVESKQSDEQYQSLPEGRFIETGDERISTFSADVDTASYSNIRRFLNAGTLPHKDAVRIEEMLNYFRYSYPAPNSGEPFSIYSEMAESPWQPGNHLLLIGLRTQPIPVQSLPPNNLVFLIDVSGSMNEPMKLPLVKRGLAMLAEQVRLQDRVAVVVYAGAAGLVLPSTSGANQSAIADAINNLEAGGSTAGGAGIRLAYQIARQNFLANGNNRVILATDGDFNVGVTSEADLTSLIEQERQSGVFLTVLGVGTGNLKDSRMEMLADKGNGHYAYLDSALEARKVLVEEMGATLNTVAKDVKLQLEFDPVRVRRYRLIGYENRVLAQKDFDHDRKDAGDIGAGHQVTALYEIEPANGVPSQGRAATLRIRYKEPQRETSKLIQRELTPSLLPMQSASANMRLASAITQFGTLLRGSPFRGQATYDSAAEQIPASDASRTELAALIRKAGTLAVPQTAAANPVQ